MRLLGILAALVVIVSIRSRRRHRAEIRFHRAPLWLPIDAWTCDCGQEACAHCPWCGLDGEHLVDCPALLGVYPVEDDGMLCEDCTAPLGLGEFYVYVTPDDDHPHFRALCLGCGARDQLGV